MGRQEPASDAAGPSTRRLSRRRVVDDGGRAVQAILGEDAAVRVEPPTAARLVAHRASPDRCAEPIFVSMGPRGAIPGSCVFATLMYPSVETTRRRRYSASRARGRRRRPTRDPYRGRRLPPAHEPSDAPGASSATGQRRRARRRRTGRCRCRESPRSDRWRPAAASSQYTHPPNASLSGTPSTSTSDRLEPVPPRPRSVMPCAAGFDARDEVRRNSVKPGTSFSASSIVAAALVSSSAEENT